MSPRAAATAIIAAAVVLVAVVGGSSPAAETTLQTRARDLLASAHPSGAEPWVTDTAYDTTRLSGWSVKADTAALTSTTCDGCMGESTALHVVHVPRSGRATLDNVASAWAQECSHCAGTALSVQVVVLGGGPVAVPDNRAVALTAACTQCRTSAVAFQVVLVTDRPVPFGAGDLDVLRAWVDQQATALRAATLELPPETLPEAPPASTGATTTPDPTTVPSPSPTGTTRPASPDPRRVRRDAESALVELEALLASALPAEVVSADVDVSR